jgi:hypothetical protein
MFSEMLYVRYFGDTGWSGGTPYLRFLALPHQQPPKVIANAMFWKNFATLFPLRAATQIGQPISQKSGSLGCRIGIFHPFHPYFDSTMINLLTIQLSKLIRVYKHITICITGRETAAKRSRAAVSRSGFMLWLALLDQFEQVMKFFTEIRQLV